MVALKLARVGGTGPLLSTPALKLARVGGTGPVAVILDPIPNQTVDPGVTVTVTAVLTGGGTADSHTWRVVSGDTVQLTTTAGVATFISPSVVDALRAPRQAVTVIGVTATLDGVTSAERTATITTLPQPSWVLDGARVWVGRSGVLL